MQMPWRFMSCMRRLKEQIDHRLQPFCQQHGLTTREVRVLMSLRLEGPATASALAHSTCMAGGNASAVCKALANKGLILRERSHNDERLVLISLSGPGRRLMAELENDLCAHGLPAAPGEIQMILEGMERIVAQLESDKEKAV